MSFSEEHTHSRKRLPAPAAPEYRRDSIVDRWVIIAPNRAARPNEFEAPPPAHSSKPCPFCEGNESLTPHEIVAYRQAGTHAEEPGWRVRVIPNKYPALEHQTGVPGSERSDGPGGQMAGPSLRSDPATQRYAIGFHEVIIESPRHLVSTTELTDAELSEVLAIYRDRLLAIENVPGVQYGLIFKNVGPVAGASIEHIHSQLVGLPMIPAAVAAELTASNEFFSKHNRCIFCDLIEREQVIGERVVMESAHFVAFCPYAPRFPFETWLFPKSHVCQFAQAAPEVLPELATLLRRCIEKIERAGGQLNYNYLIHSAPFDTCSQSHYHWHIEIFPRMTTLAGFEWATGQFINPVSPEVAADLLRQQ